MRNYVIAVALILAAAALSAQSPAGYVAPYGAVSPQLAEGASWTLPVVFEDAGFVKLHLAGVSLGEGESIRLYAGDRPGTAVYTLEGPFNGNSWLPSVDGETAVLEVSSKGGAVFSVDKAGIGFTSAVEAGAPERVCGNDDRLDPACYDASLRGIGDKVGRILFEANGTLHYCSGFLVGADGLFATSQHCIYDAEVAATAEVRWKYEMTSCGGSVAEFDTVSTGCELVMADPNTDLTLMKFSADNPASRYGYLALDDREVEKDEVIWIPQHSEGGPKKFAVHSDSDGGATILAKSLTGARATQAIGYNLDVEAGSSGSPVIDTNNKVIGIHAFTALNEGCESPDLNKAIKMEVLYPVIEPYLATCAGIPPVITKVRYIGTDRVFKLTGTGFTENSLVLVDGVAQSTKLRKNGKLAAAMFDKIFKGESVTIEVFCPDTGCTSGEVYYIRPL